MRCKNCGQEIPSDSKFCAYCGTQIEESPMKTQSEPTMDHSAGKRKKILVASLTGIVIICIIGVLYISQSHKTDNKVAEVENTKETNDLSPDTDNQEAEANTEEEKTDVSSDSDDHESDSDEYLAVWDGEDEYEDEEVEDDSKTLYAYQAEEENMTGTPDEEDEDEEDEPEYTKEEKKIAKRTAKYLLDNHSQWDTYKLSFYKGHMKVTVDVDRYWEAWKDDLKYKNFKYSACCEMIKYNPVGGSHTEIGVIRFTDDYKSVELTSFMLSKFDYIDNDEWESEEDTRLGNLVASYM